MKISALEPKPLSEYFLNSGVVTLLFTVAGLIAVGQGLTYFATAMSFENALQMLRAKTSVAQWFVSAVMVFSAVLCLSLARASANGTDRKVWKGMALFMALLSASSVSSLSDFFGWAYFPVVHIPALSFWWGAFAVLCAASLGAGYFLRNSLQDSSRAAKALMFGVLFYLVGALGEAVMLAGALLDSTPSIFWSVRFVLHSTFKMLGVTVFLSGLIFHEEFLQSQLRRLRSGEKQDGLPSAKTDRAAWALRMIGTPTRDEILMQDEVTRASRSQTQTQGTKAAE